MRRGLRTCLYRDVLLFIDTHECDENMASSAQCALPVRQGAANVVSYQKCNAPHQPWWEGESLWE
jgi:hypothetical protein